MDKLTANELRIGNLVTDEFYDSFKTIIKVQSINEKGINLLIEDDGNWSEIAQRWIGVEYAFDKLRRIPLTEECLLRFGAIDLDAPHYKQFRLGERLIVVRDGKFVDYGSSVILEYVHTLQNFIFALTNAELTIKSN